MMPFLPVNNVHVCPICKLNVHGPCGIEDEGAPLKDKTTCFTCHDKGQALLSTHSPATNAVIDTRLATKTPPVAPAHAKRANATFTGFSTSTSAAASAKRATETSLQYESDDDVGEVQFVATIPATRTLNDQFNSNSTTSTSTAAKEAKSRPKKKGKCDSLLMLKKQFLVLKHKYVSPGSKKVTSHWAGKCFHCLKEYEKQLKEQSGPFPPVVPNEISLWSVPMEKHLKSCDPYKLAVRKAYKNGVGENHSPFENESPGTLSGLSSIEQSEDSVMVCKHCNCSCRGKVKPGSVSRFFPMPLTPSQVAEVNVLLIEMFVDCAIPFRAVERPSFKRLVEKLRPNAGAQLPLRTTVRKLLKSAAETAQRHVEADIDEELANGHRAGLVVDTWSNVNKIHIEGVLLTLGARSFMLHSQLSGFNHHGLAVASGWDTLIFNTYHQYTFHYFCSDDAGQCARARRILAFRYPFIIFNRCWAHQINLMVKSLLTRSSFSTTCTQAIDAAKAFNASSSKWLPRLRDECESLYGKRAPSSVFTVGETRWNSTQACFGSLLRIKRGCQSFALKNDHETKYPADLLIIKDTTFWIKLQEAELLIRPFCDASFLMQREANTMADVVLVLLNLYGHIHDYCGDSDEAQVLLVDMEKRWAAEENPLFFLTFALHPAYRQTACLLLEKSVLLNGNWRQDKNFLSSSRVVESAKFYYGKFELLTPGLSNNEKNYILNDLGDSVDIWVRNKRFDIRSTYKQGNDPVEWWSRQKEEYPSIANLAMFLLDAPVQSANCERLFKEFSRLHTKVRNRLDPKTTHEMAQVKYDIRRKNREDVAFHAASGSTNRFVSPTEHPRVDRNVTPVKKGSSNDSDKESDSDSKKEDTTILDDEASACESVDKTGGLPGRWLEALSRAVDEVDLDDDDVFYESDADAVGETTERDCEDYTGQNHTTEEECFEKRRFNLPSLPEEQNDPKWPQENAAYFKRKKPENYVRTDKYKLATLHGLCQLFPDGSQLPSIMSVYGNKK